MTVLSMFMGFSWTVGPWMGPDRWCRGFPTAPPCLRALGADWDPTGDRLPTPLEPSGDLVGRPRIGRRVVAVRDELLGRRSETPQVAAGTDQDLTGHLRRQPARQVDVERGDVRRR